MNDDTRKRGRTLIPVALATLAAAVALPVSAALAGGDEGSSGSGTTLEQPGYAPTQDREDGQGQQGQPRPDRDCPEGQDGDRGSGESQGGSSSSTTEL